MAAARALGRLGRETAVLPLHGALFDPSEGRVGVVVTFLAILELLKEQLLELVQAEPYAPMHLRAGRGEPVEIDLNLPEPDFS